MFTVMHSCSPKLLVSYTHETTVFLKCLVSIYFAGTFCGWRMVLGQFVWERKRDTTYSEPASRKSVGGPEVRKYILSSLI